MSDVATLHDAKPKAANDKPRDRRRQRRGAGNRLILRAVDWKSYSRLLHALDELHLRLTYDRGVLEIMTLSPEHESGGEFLGVLVGVLTRELKKPIKRGGSTTFRKRSLKKGLEPDRCYWIANESKMRGKKRIDLDVDPPPDLAIEMDVTRSSLKRMGIYAALGVPEVWRLDETGLSFHVLSAQGAYQLAEESLSFPGLKASDLAPFLQMQADTEENALTEQFRDWVRQKFETPKT